MTNDKLLLNGDKTEFPMTGTKQQLAKVNLDCKTVCIFAYSINREQSNKMSRMHEAENRERDRGETLKIFSRLLRHALPISLLILTKKPTVLQSKVNRH